MTKRRFYAAKINVHENIFNQNLPRIIHEEIPRVILNPTTVKLNSWNWTFTDYKSSNIDDRLVILGNVTKSKRQKQKVRIKNQTTEVLSEHELAISAFFVYDLDSEILIHEGNSYITTDDFIGMFTKLLSTDPFVGDVKIISIPEPFKIRQEIESMQKVTKIYFHLIHPNPGKDDFNLYQQVIKEGDLLELEIQMANVKKGIDLGRQISGDKVTYKKPIENGIELVEAGYGAIELKGEDTSYIQGKRKMRKVVKHRHFSSRKAIRSFSTTEIENEPLLKRIIEFIQNVRLKLRDGGEGDDQK